MFRMVGYTCRLSLEHKTGQSAPTQGVDSIGVNLDGKLCGQLAVFRSNVKIKKKFLNSETSAKTLAY